MADIVIINPRFDISSAPYWASHRWAWAKRCFLNYGRFLVVTSRLLRLVADEALRSRYRQQLLRVVRKRGLEPHILFVYALKVATPLSLCGDHACFGAGRAWQRRPAQCWALLLAGKAASRGTGGRLGNLGATAKDDGLTCTGAQLPGKERERLHSPSKIQPLARAPELPFKPQFVAERAPSPGGRACRASWHLADAMWLTSLRISL